MANGERTDEISTRRLMTEPHEIFSALGDRTRLGVLTALARSGPATATELAATIPVTRQAISKHLAALDAVGLVTRHQEGREVRYQFEADALDTVASWATDTAGTWDRRLDRLRRSLE